MTSKIIWKYTLSENQKQTIEIPAKSKILCAKNQKDKAVLYVIFDSTDNPNVKRSIRVFVMGTGESMNIPDEAQYVGTLLFESGFFVFHYFVCEGE
jgi:hypothetical protein